MKAAFYTRNGPAHEVLTLGDRPRRAPSEGEVLVELRCSGVNPSDVKSRAARPLAGAYVIPHSDGAGVIAEVGPGVEASRIGERVWLWNAQWQRADGTAAQTVTLPAAQAVPLPEAAAFEVGACAGIPLLTAIQAVAFATEQGAASILVTGAGNAVGHYVCQLAQQRGMHVIGTASDQRAELVTETGATRVNYQTGDLADAVREANDGQPVDAIVDMDFSSTAGLLQEAVLKPHGSVICYGSNDMTQVPVPFRDLLFNSYALRFFLVYTLTEAQRAAALQVAQEALQSGRLITRIDGRFALDQIAEAHQRVETGAALGNVVIDLGA